VSIGRFIQQNHQTVLGRLVEYFGRSSNTLTRADTKAAVYNNPSSGSIVGIMSHIPHWFICEVHLRANGSA
jgi:hypothetical protein